MAIVPVHTKRANPPDLAELLALRPPTWTDDGLSCFPDSVFGWDIRDAGSGHDLAYCSRMWPPGALDRAHREKYDAKLGEWVWALLPFGLRASGVAVAFAVYQVGGMKAFDSCGIRPYGAKAGQMALGLCRHGVPAPQWLGRK